MRRIRVASGLCRKGLIRQTGAEELGAQNTVSGCGLGRREPPLPVLLKYAEPAGVCPDVPANDDPAFPAKLTGKPKREAARRAGREGCYRPGLDLWELQPSVRRSRITRLPA